MLASFDNSNFNENKTQGTIKVSKISEYKKAATYVTASLIFNLFFTFFLTVQFFFQLADEYQINVSMNLF